MIRLVTAYCEPPTGSRLTEICECLARNAALPVVDQINVFTADCAWLPPLEKLFGHQLDRRPTFTEMLRFAAGLAADGDVTVVLNADCHFDDTFAPALQYLNPGACWALSRSDLMADGALRPWWRRDSQDAWVMRGPVKPVTADFTPGVPGCDNRLAHELKQAGYTVTNPCRTVRVIHRHLGEKGYNRRTVVPPPYQFVDPVDLARNAPLKVLHVALNYRKPQAGLCRALQTIGNYREIDWIKVSKDGQHVRLLEPVLAAAAEWQPDLTFIQAQHDGIVTPIVKKMGFTVGFSGDVRVPLQELYFTAAKELNVSVFTDLESAEAVRARGWRAEHSYIGYDHCQFTPQGASANGGEIVFFGNDYGARFPLGQFRRDMVKYLAARYGARFAAYGNFPGARRNLMFNEAAEAAVYRGCRVAVGVSQFAHRRYTSDRAFRAMGSGACYLAHHWTEIEADFTPGIHLDTWRDFDELGLKLDALLADEPRRKSIAIAGQLRAEQNYSWAAFMPKLLGWYNAR